ncbi:unnamed protein product [Closterium sp. Naga37s-1]|nr:unnamed protein product [Closterium sp. Naga37s-1]
MGKTLIAVMLMQARRQMRERSGKICVFLVPAVALVIQQAAVVEQQTDMRVGKYSTDTEIKYEAAWVQKQVSQHEVLVMTPQVLVNLLQHAFLCLSSVDLLIFDECHHTAKDHAYATIMKTWYFSLKQADRPLIFGMTASPINTKGSGSEESCVQQLLDFERILDSKLYTVLDRSCLVEVLPSAQTIQSHYDPPGEEQAEVLVKLRERVEKEREGMVRWIEEEGRRVVDESGGTGQEAGSEGWVEEGRGEEQGRDGHQGDRQPNHQQRWTAAYGEVRRRMVKRVKYFAGALDWCLTDLGRYPAFLALHSLRAQAASGGMDQHEENARLRNAFAAVRLEFINRCEAFLRCGLPPEAKAPGPG